jgi:hypothetical protein
LPVSTLVALFNAIFNYIAAYWASCILGVIPNVPPDKFEVVVKLFNYDYNSFICYLAFAVLALNSKLT